MKILVIGELIHFQECTLKFGAHHCNHFTSPAEAEKLLQDQEVIFDFRMDPTRESLIRYTKNTATVFLNTCKVSLSSLALSTDGLPRCTVFGFNGLPTLFNREFLEVSQLKNEDTPILEKVCRELNTGYLLVDDRIGLVTPRVICMIINEAYYTVQEGTATREDIDVAMKLGTNYPYGPFEWCEKIGLRNVYQLLEAVYDDTKDERYKIASLMKKEYLRLGVEFK